MPQPRISIQPVCLQGRQGSLPRFPLPPQMKQETIISALGSVKGKNDGRKLVFTLDPNSAFMAWSSVPFKSQKVMFVSTAKPFDLVEHRRVAGVGRIVAMYRARNHDADRRLHLLHGANLHRRSVSPQQQTLALRLRFLPGDEQRVLRVARRMVGRKIQRLEVVIVGLDHRPFLHRVAEIAEDGDDLVHRLDHGMFRAERAANAGEGDVEAVSRCSDRRSRRDW